MRILSILICVFFSLSLSAQPTSKEFLNRKNLLVPEGSWLSHHNTSLNNRSEPFRLDSSNLWIWNGIEYDLLFRSLYSYNTEGLTDAILELIVDNGISMNSSVDSFSYDQEGRVVFRQTSGWTGSEWMGFVRIYTTYEQNSQEEIRQFFDGIEWVNNSKSYTEYDANGRVTGGQGYEWDGSDWVLSARSTYLYNPEGFVDTILSESYVNNVWEMNQRAVYTYDDEGRLTSFLSQNFEEGEWVNNFLATYTYENDLQIQTDQLWSFNQWETIYRTVRKFDDERVIYLASSSWDGLEWMKVDSIHYYYSDLASSVNHADGGSDVSFYPNPVQNTLIVETNGEFASNTFIEIFSAIGERVYTDRLCIGNKCEVEIQSLNPGVYFAIINNGHVRESVKFLKM